ncbi:copper resistance protein B [Acinetobacter sp. ANC 4805]|uniref:copper resistance protein B n=1 Tax=Acinetobacter sp. ANC 4805 TaxID=2923425 RepID=UPI001F4ADF3D|nr:copper resistance protein B [Acinetobacter sp. ANC 4805]MCH7312411.1 copper resistance protein B [Acinetobacter sp. ANC 4805]
MHITKQPSTMKRYTQLLAIGGMISSLSAFASAHEGHDQMMQMDQPVQQNILMETSSSVDHSGHQLELRQVPSDIQHDAHDHHREHGGQIYQATTIKNAWVVDDGRGSASTELKTWVGGDENKIFIKAHVEKAESEYTQTEAMLLYSRNIADFWDVQAGVRYQYQPEQKHGKNQWGTVLGLHGLAPYFFETEAYLYAGQDQRWQLSLETTRDVLFTQKLIAQPYLNVDVMLSDESNYAVKSGLSKLQTGVQTRYEISKKVMPFIDIAYTYNKGLKQTEWQSASDSERGWLYGLGLTLKF